MKKVTLLLSFLLLASGLLVGQDLPAEIRRQLDTGEARALFYPKSVKRFYEQAGFNPTWIRPQNGEGPAWQAMLLLDCVLQYGLAHDDYHPKELRYDQLHAILDTPGKVDIRTQARFEILLTDAIITFMNHLHYGKLNPAFAATAIDEGIGNNFRAEAALAQAFAQKKAYNFFTAVTSVQPASKAYRELQYQLRLATGLYTGDCYEVPEKTIRTMAINLERLRWLGTDESSFIQVNIPSYMLRFVRPDSTYMFRVAVGKVSSPTPMLASAISYFTTGPDIIMPKKDLVNTIIPNTLKDTSYLRNNHLAIYDKKGQFIIINPATLANVAAHPGDYQVRHGSGHDRSQGNLAFHFPGVVEIDLHDFLQKDLFNRDERAFSSGCVWLYDAEKLAELLLNGDGRQNELGTLHKAVTRYERKTFILQKKVPLKITYLTCEVKEGQLILYKDIYNLDKSVEAPLYNIKQGLVMR